MKWLKDFLSQQATEASSARKSDPVAGSDWEDPISPQIDWTEFEIALSRLIESELSKFSETHEDEVFYAFALDCNATYGDVLLCLNTPTALHETALAYHAKHPNRSVDAEIDNLRWSLGDWKYQGFNLNAPTWTQQYSAALPFGDELSMEEDIEQFLVAACRAMIHAERKGAFANLSRTADFRIMCIDHDEDALEGDKRLARVRASF
jgi:hypothetical protein